MAKYVVVINTKTLFKAFCHQMSFMSINQVICFMFDLENPLAIDNIPIGLWRYQIARFIVHEGSIFIIHSHLPTWSRQRFLKRMRLTRCGGESVANCAIGVHFRLENPGLKTSVRRCKSWISNIGWCRRSQRRIQDGFKCRNRTRS
jgi:hypothetical protein